MHACTWSDSRNVHWPAARWAGRHAFSRDGVTWQYSPIPAYNATLRLTNGSTVVFSRMERPFLLFGDNGAPTHMYTGVQRYDWDDASFTLVQPIMKH